MTAGLQVFNADGSLQLDISHRTFRVMTVADIGTVNSGTIPADLSMGVAVASMAISEDRRAPTVTLSSGGATWDYGSIPIAQRDSSFQLTLMLF